MKKTFLKAEKVVEGNYEVFRNSGFLTITDEEFEYLRKLIFKECGIDLKPHKKYLIVNRLAKRLRNLGLATFSDYINFLNHGGQKHQELIELIDAVTTNKTEFFREPAHFNFLQERIVPEIVKDHSRMPRVFRVWSAASSSGEEPYTIAICLSEAFSKYPGWKFEIMASDISETILRTAIAGVYEEDKVKPVPLPLLKKYFLKGETKYKVKPELAGKVTFKKINLQHDFHLSLRNYDVIFNRNVMIYFNRETQSSIINKCWQVLRPGGYLLLGHSETLQGMNTPFRYLAPATYQKGE